MVIPLPFLLLLTASASAETVYSDAFDTDLGLWEGGAVSGGLLVIEEGLATLSLGPLSAFEVELRLTKTDAGTLRFEVGDAAWEGDYTEGGGISLGAEALPFPEGQRQIVPDTLPLFEPGSVYWYGANALHCDIHYDAISGTWFLYWTGEIGAGYPYRQIGVAISTDGVHWAEYVGNPVLTIDYDKTSVDGIHVHMPSVAVGPDGTWHMYYSCYQDSVGNRICHATSLDGFDWTPQGVVLDFGAAGEFDSGSLRMPDVLVDSTGQWHMLYNGTLPDEHYGPTGYATSEDGWTWEKQGAITLDETRLQGGGMVETPYGIEQWWNCADVFCTSVALVADLRIWEDWPVPVLAKGWATWSSGYIQAPSVWLQDSTYHFWFNAYDYGVDNEVIAHAKTVPLPGTAITLYLSWDGHSLSGRVDEGPTLRTALDAASGLGIRTTGQVEIDEISVVYHSLVTDTGGGEDTAEDSGGGPADSAGASDDGGTPTEDDSAAQSATGKGAKEGGCACNSAPNPGWLAAALGFGLSLRRRRRSPGQLRKRGTVSIWARTR